MRKVLKLICINALVLIFLLLLTDFISLLIFSLNDSYSKKNKEKRLDKAATRITSLPAYKNASWAREQFDEEQLQKFSYRSFIGWRKLPFEGRTINVDSNGIRKTFHTEHVGDSSATVVFLGGSTMWGDYTHDSCTIPSFFNLLSNGKYNSLNYGEDSYCAYQEFLFLQMKLIQGIRPKIVITYDGVNNAPGMVQRPFSHRREEQIAYHIDGADQKKPHPKFSDYYLKPTKELMYSLRNKWFTDNEQQFQETVNVQMSDSAAAIYLLDSWMATRQLSNQYGCKFICVLQPNIYIGKPLIAELKKQIVVNYSYYNLIPGLLNTQKYKSLKENFIDLTRLFDNREHIYIDFCHVGPEGNQMIADYLLKYIEQQQ
jgi:hypothetical protein